MNKFGYILVLLSLSSCNSSVDQDLLGTWFSNDYTCGKKKFPDQKFEIKSIEDTLFCVKLTGDPCVRRGDTSWFVFRNGTSWTGFIKGTNLLNGHTHTTEIELKRINSDSVLIKLREFDDDLLFFR
jgi:hypothetical protein